MKLYLETHKLAPEQNKVILIKSGKELKAPNITTIKDARKQFFNPIKKGKFCTIDVFVNLDFYTSYKGYIKNYNEVRDFLKLLKQKHNLPNTHFNINTKYIG